MPADRLQLHGWIRTHLRLPPPLQRLLLQHIDRVLDRWERMWQQSKEEAVAAVVRTLARRTAELREQLLARDAAAVGLAQHFEALVADLLDRANRDSKTGLLHGRRFVDQLATFLSLEQRGRWCAVGVVDIRDFKSYNDALGHLGGDAIIDQVARLLREQIRPEDVLASEAWGVVDMHARYGGDEFSFLIPRLDRPASAYRLAERFRAAVAAHAWATVDSRLHTTPVQVDVGVASLLLGPVEQRREHAAALAEALLEHADRLMYAAKAGAEARAVHARFRIRDARLVEFDADPERRRRCPLPAAADHDHASARDSSPSVSLPPRRGAVSEKRKRQPANRQHGFVDRRTQPDRRASAAQDLFQRLEAKRLSIEADRRRQLRRRSDRPPSRQR